METLTVDHHHSPSSSAIDTTHGTAVNRDPKMESSSPKVDAFNNNTMSGNPFLVSPDSTLHDPFIDAGDKSKSTYPFEDAGVASVSTYPFVDIVGDESKPPYDSSMGNREPIHLGEGNIDSNRPVTGSDLPNSMPQDHELPPRASTSIEVNGNASGWVLDKGSAIESPPVQMMERPKYDPNRIPDFVFDRTKSTANPMEWSVASNESLFSIHMGNMSFTKDQFLFRSGELGAPGEFSSDQMFNFSGPFPPPAKTVERKESGELRTETAVETMREVIRESEDKSTKTVGAAERPAFHVTAEGPASHVSRDSNNSTKSFAFPV